MKYSDHQMRLIGRASLEQANNLYIVVSETGAIRDANQAVCALLDFSVKELSTTNIAAIDLNLNQEGWASFSETIRALSSVNIETAFLNKKRAPISVHAVISAYLDAGEWYYTYFAAPSQSGPGVQHNREQLDILDSIERNGHIGSWSICLPTLEEVWSAENYRLLNVDPNIDTICYEKFQNLLNTSDRIMLERLRIRCLKTSSEQRFEWQVEREGQRQTLLCILNVVITDDGRPFKLCGTLQDISTHKEKEDKLRLAKEAAEFANLAKSTFIANVSHEIKTPVAAIAGYVSLLNDLIGHSESAKYYLSIVQQNADYLLEITSNLLDATRIEANHIELNMTSGRVHDTVEAAAALVQLEAQRKNLEFRIQSSFPLAGQINTDHMVLKRILTNLLSNAVKYTDSGSVNLAISYNNNDHTVRFVVSDTGCGMTEEQVSRLFSRYERFLANTSMPKEGVGLGLHISKKMTDLLGGKIWVDSRLGVGSSFVLELPLSEAVSPITLYPVLQKQEANRPDGAIDLEPPRLLLAEDTEELRELYKTVLVRAGFEVDVASNGKECVEKALVSREQNRPYGLILMDVQMPVFDGTAATRLLRQRGWEEQIIALTANPISGDFLEQYKTAGYSDCFSKSIKTQILVGLIRDKYHLSERRMD